MKQYLINDLQQDGIDYIITLLDYETQISKCLKSITVSPCRIGKVLIDTAICSGLNEYRFIETHLREDGTLDLGECEYVSVKGDVLKAANDVLRCHPTFLRNSVLPEAQINKFAQG